MQRAGTVVKIREITSFFLMSYPGIVDLRRAGSSVKEFKKHLSLPSSGEDSDCTTSFQFIPVRLQCGFVSHPAGVTFPPPAFSPPGLHVTSRPPITPPRFLSAQSSELTAPGPEPTLTLFSLRRQWGRPAQHPLFCCGGGAHLQQLVPRRAARGQGSRRLTGSADSFKEDRFFSLTTQLGFSSFTDIKSQRS